MQVCDRSTADRHPRSYMNLNAQPHTTGTHTTTYSHTGAQHTRAHKCAHKVIQVPTGLSLAREARLSTRTKMTTQPTLPIRTAAMV